MGVTIGFAFYSVAHTWFIHQDPQPMSFDQFVYKPIALIALSIVAESIVFSIAQLICQLLNWTANCFHYVITAILSVLMACSSLHFFFTHTAVWINFVQSAYMQPMIAEWSMGCGLLVTPLIAVFFVFGLLIPAFAPFAAYKMTMLMLALKKLKEETPVMEAPATAA